MDVDGDYEPQASKRKRVDEPVDSDGEEEKEDDEEDEERKVKRPRARVSKRREVKGTGKFYNPSCDTCAENGAKCEKQAKYWACCRCAIKKIGCKRGDQSKRRNARVSGPEDGEDDEDDEELTSEGEAPSARQPVAVPRKRLDRKGKGKGKWCIVSCLSIVNENIATEPEDAVRHQVRHLDDDAERRADKARIQELERRVQELENAVRRHNRFEDSLGFLDDKREDAEGRIDDLEEFCEGTRDRFEEWEERWRGMSASSSTAAAPAAPSPPPIQQRPPMVVVVPATPQNSQTQVGVPLLQALAHAPPATGPSTSSLPAEPSDLPQAHVGEPSPAPDVIGSEPLGRGDVDVVNATPDSMPPTPPWRQPPAPSTDLLAPPVPEDPNPKSPRRSRTRSPAPPPSCRSPRLQSPAPPAAVDDVSMDVDK